MHQMVCVFCDQVEIRDAFESLQVRSSDYRVLLSQSSVQNVMSLGQRQLMTRHVPCRNQHHQGFKAGYHCGHAIWERIKLTAVSCATAQKLQVLSLRGVAVDLLQLPPSLQVCFKSRARFASWLCSDSAEDCTTVHGSWPAPLAH